MYNISMEKLKRLTIIIPPQELQELFVTRVQQIDKSKYLNPVHYMRGRKRR